MLDKLVEEVRTTFKSEDEIDLMSVNGLEYMLACLKESLRQYPPAPIGMPRVVPKGGFSVAGHWTPEDVSSLSLHLITRFLSEAAGIYVVLAPN